jgi:hypothetical protein
MGAETQRKRFPPSIEVERVISQLRPAIESAPLRLEPFVAAPMRWPGERAAVFYKSHPRRQMSTNEYEFGCAATTARATRPES